MRRSSRPPRAAPSASNLDIGPYRLANRIAVGGMAEVFRAMLPQAAGGDRAVVIKRMLPELLEEPSCVAMFEREAALGLRIQHPNVVEVLGTGQHEGAPYLALEYVFGVDLWRLNRFLMARGEVLPRGVALYLVTELLRGLAAVHEVRDDAGQPLRITHRDVSPSNVFLSVHGDVKLGDLGIARAAMRDAHMAAPGGENAKGKLGYLPPEDVIGEDIDPRSDLFSAGVIAAELLMGRPLFAGGTEIAVLLAIRDGDLSAFERTARELPEGLADAVRGALARRIEDRIESARALREALLPYVEGEVSALRQQLGERVIAAVERDAQVEGPIDRTSLAVTVEARPEHLLEALGASAELAAQVVSRATRTDLISADPRTERTYELMAGGRSFGPFPYARVVRGLLSGEIPPDAMVRMPDGSLKKVTRVPDLARHLPPSSRTPTLVRTQMAQTTQVYDLGHGGIVEALVSMFLLRESGLLLCERDHTRKEVYIVLGAPGFVTSNVPEELLGESLVAEGMLDRAELDLALALIPRYEGRLGDTLTALGLVEPLALFRHIERQVRDKLLDLFTWEVGTASFYAGVERPEREFPLRLDPWEVLDAGLARRAALGQGDRRLDGKEGAVLIPVPHAHRPSTISEPAEMVLGALAVPRSLGELDGVLAEPGHARRVVSVLVAMGALAFRG